MRWYRPVSAAIVLVAAVTGGFAWGFTPTATVDASSPRQGEYAAATPHDGGVATGVIGAPGGTTAAWVKAENAKPGTSDWRLDNPSRHGEIEGYADHVSATRGDTVTLYVSTKASAFYVEAYRMGYYGGLGGRLVWRSSDLDGVEQSKAHVDADTHMVEARWSPSLQVPITAAWPEGDYLFKLVASSGKDYYVPLTLRNDASHAAYVVQNSVTTWQAYNVWGGFDLYEGRSGSTSSFDQRARIVSFDRPYELGSGSGDFLGNELPLVSLVESLGLDVTYWTDIDLHQRGDLLANHRALLSLGHDEYWSTAMRVNAQTARDKGVNLVFFGANAIFRHIRMGASSLGPNRHEIDYKSARADPLYGTDNSEVTVDWREPPLSKPENTLIGEMYECNPVKADMVVHDASSWVFEGTGLHDGDHLHDVIGTEYDRYQRGGPPNVAVLAHSPLRCRGLATYSDMTYYTAPSGAGVFATGTNWWISKLTSCPNHDCPHDDNVIRITENVLAAFGAGPAGRVHPSVSNTATLPRAPSAADLPTASTTRRRTVITQQRTSTSTRSATSATTTARSSTTRSGTGSTGSPTTGSTGTPTSVKHPATTAGTSQPGG